jgi:hypothetical protein
MPEHPSQPALLSRIADLCPVAEKPTGMAFEVSSIPPGKPFPKRRRRSTLLASEEELIRDAWARVRAEGSCATLANARGNLRANVNRALARHLKSTRQAAIFDPTETVEDVLRRIEDSFRKGATKTYNDACR